MKRRNKLCILFLILISVLNLTACMRETTEKRVLVKAVKRRADDTLWAKTTYEYDNYGRKVKKLTIEDGKTRVKHTWEYDKQGNVVKEYVLDLRMGRIERRDIRKFDDQGRKIEHKIINKSKYSPDYDYYKYKYNDQDQLTEKIALNKSGDIVWKRIYDYDQAGRQILYKSIDQNGEVYKLEKWKYNDEGKEIYYLKTIEGQEEEKVITKYDEEGNEVLYKEYEDGEIEHHYKSIFDKKGNEVKILAYNNDGKISWIGYCKYDNDGNKIKEKRVYQKNNTIKIQNWKYDNNGNKLKYWGTENGKLDFEWIWEYDENGNLVYHEKRNGEEEVTDWDSYEWYDNGQKKMSNTPIIPSGRSVWIYDKNGNLIEKKHIADDGEEIEYWEKYYYNENNKKVKKVWGRKKTTSGYRKYKYKDIKVYENN